MVASLDSPHRHQWCQGTATQDPSLCQNKIPYLAFPSVSVHSRGHHGLWTSQVQSSSLFPNRRSLGFRQSPIISSLTDASFPHPTHPHTNLRELWQHWVHAPLTLILWPSYEQMRGFVNQVSRIQINTRECHLPHKCFLTVDMPK